MENLNTKNLGNQFAVAKGKQRAVCLTMIQAGLVSAEHIPEHVEQELKLGFTVAFTDANPQFNATYGYIDGNYVLLDADKAKAFKGEKLQLSVGFVMAESQQKFGALKNSNPALHALMLPIRQAVQKYVSNTYNAFKKQVAEIDRESKGVPKTRSATKSFDETLKSFFDDCRKKIVNAKARGDETADEAKFRKALVAFNTVWNHQ